MAANVTWFLAVAFLKALEQVTIRVGTWGFGAILLGEESFEWPDRDRFIDRAAAAGIFAWGRTDSAADGSERVGRTRYEKRLLVSLL